MTDHESDGISETFASSTRVWLTAGGLVAERLVREREQHHRDAQATSQQAARAAQQRLQAQRATARAALQAVTRQAWWERATPEQIGVAWQTAQAWRDSDRVAADAALRVRDEVRRRYDIDVDNLDADPGAVRDALAQRERALRLSEQAHDKQHADHVATEQLAASADRADREQQRAQQRAEQTRRDAPDRDAAGAVYDSAERRAAMADRLRAIADEETIQAVVTADTMQARPAQDAVTRTPSKAPVPGRGRGRGGAQRATTRRSERGR